MAAVASAADPVEAGSSSAPLVGTPGRRRRRASYSAAILNHADAAIKAAGVAMAEVDEAASAASKGKPAKGKGGGGWFNLANTVRGKVSKKKIRYQRDGFDLDLTYITPRIIAMGFPSEGTEGWIRNPMTEVQRFFEEYHPGRYMIYNLCSERAYDHACFLGRAVRFPFDDHNPPMLNMIPEFCAHMDSWLGAHPENVVSIHCKAGKGRTGCLIAAYLVHCGMFSDPEDALTFFGRRRTENEKGVTIASQMRYVHYYSHMLHHGPMPIITLRILHVRLLTVPDVESGSCAPSLEVRVNNSRVFDFARAAGALRRFRRPAGSIDLDLTPWDLRVRENVMLQFYHHSGAGLDYALAASAKQSADSAASSDDKGGKSKKGDGTKKSDKASPLGKRKKLCHLWFHTGYVRDCFLAFSRGVVDKASKDKKGIFAPSFQVEIYFEPVLGEASPALPELAKKKKKKHGDDIAEWRGLMGEEDEEEDDEDELVEEYDTSDDEEDDDEQEDEGGEGEDEREEEGVAPAATMDAAAASRATPHPPLAEP